MTNEHEPARWLDDPDASAALRSDLAHGASATASGIDYGATLTALRSAIAAQTAALPAATAGSSMSVGAKVIIGVLAAGGLAAWLARGDVESSKQPSTVARAQVEPTAVSSPAPVVAPVAVQPSVAKPIAPPTEPDEIELIEPAPEAADPRGVAKPRKRVDGTERTTPAADVPEVEAPSPDADRYVREAKLLAQARRALADDPTRALALTRQVEREFPNGLLEEERRALEIRALAALGRDDEANGAAKGFLAKFPDGPHAAAVRRAIED